MEDGQEYPVRIERVVRDIRSGNPKAKNAMYLADGDQDWRYVTDDKVLFDLGAAVQQKKLTADN
jgi:hypothetical protein